MQEYKKNGAKLDLGNLDEVIDNILNKVTIDDTHDIPYLAGYSDDGKTIYIDRHYDQSKYGIKYLVFHEYIEKHLIEDLGYDNAHRIATAAEMELVEYDGVKWNVYEGYMEKFIKTAESEQLIDIPEDLDLTPYSGKLLRSIMNAQ